MVVRSESEYEKAVHHLFCSVFHYNSYEMICKEILRLKIHETFHEQKAVEYIDKMYK